MTRLRPTAGRLAARQRLDLRTASASGSGLGSVRNHGDDGLLAPLRRHRRWTLVGLIVAALATATRFASIGILPPSINVKPFAHATASTKLALGEPSFGYSRNWREPYSVLSTPTYALADMTYSPLITEYVARAARLPASKIGILGPQWIELQRTQQFPSGPQRDRQITIENDPYQITIDQETTFQGEGQGKGVGPPVIDVVTQAHSAEVAARLASAVYAALHAYVEQAQAMAGVPERYRYNVSQLVPVSVSPARKSQLATVGVFTFFAVLVLWWGAEVAVASLLRDLRTAAALKARDSSDRCSDSGPLRQHPA
jgi:hypothetical protein